MPSDLLDALTAAPVGVALLGRLEARVRADTAAWEMPPDSTSAAVDMAAHEVETMDFGEFLATALDAGYMSAGPWSGYGVEHLELAYPHAEARRRIAEAIAARFGAQLGAPFDADRQEWWQCGHTDSIQEVLTGDFGRVYGNGEFPWAAVRTVTGPPGACHRGLLTAWEFDDEPVFRWRLPVAHEARVWEIHRAQDWVDLVERYPKPATGPHYGWELPGPNQHYVPRAAFDVLGPGVVRDAVERHVLPDWSDVARDFDGVHLSWAGWLSSEGFISELPSGGVTMLRYWFSDRTFWLRDVFGEPEPLPPPDAET